MASLDDIVSAAKNAVVAINNLATTLKSTLAGAQSTAPTATGGAKTLPANPAGFLTISLPDGTPARVPYYNP